MVLTRTTGEQKETMAMGASAPNRLQDLWVWNGRPNWDTVFSMVKDDPPFPHIGVAFCGAAIIGKDLQKMCGKHSSTEDGVFFHLHKENF